MKNIHKSNSLLIDSGFWVALGNKKDKHHFSAKQALSQFDSFVFVVTWPIIVEASHLLYKRVGFQAQMTFMSNIEKDGAEIFHIDETRHLNIINALMIKYRDLPMDLADASLVILAEELGHGRILSTDQRDFKTYRLKNHRPFENLLLPDS